MSTQPTPDFDPAEDVLGMFEVIGADPAPTHPEATARFVPHPSHAKEFTELALELLVREWSPAQDIEGLDPDVPIPFTVVHDDGECAGDCGRTVCHCIVACEGTVDQGPCDHGWRLCDECRLTCDECRANVDGDVQ